MSNLTQKQKHFVQLYMSGEYKTHEIAQIIGVHRTTLWRWLHLEEVQSYAVKWRNYKMREWRRKQGNISLLDKLEGDDPFEANRAANTIINIFLRNWKRSTQP